MFSMETSRPYSYEFDDLSDGMEAETSKETEKIYPKIPTCPRIIISFFGVPTPALIDTGSQITAISEIFMNIYCNMVI